MSVDRERTVVTKFDRALVGRWFGLLLDSRAADDGDRHPLIWAVTPSPGERKVLAWGAVDIGVAIEADVLPTARLAAAEPTAALLQEYLAGVAAGIAGVGRSLSGPPAGQPHGTDRAPMADEPAGPSGEGTDRLALVAGLIAGAAAIQLAEAGTRDGHRPESAAAQRFPWSMSGLASTPGQTGLPARPSAADIARAAGTTAAELVVDGAGLHDIAAAAAQSAMRGWSVGPTDGRAADTVDGRSAVADRRVRTLVAQILLALERAARPPAPAAEPASCGAGPGDHRGSGVRAEVTFVVFTSDSDAARLRADLEPLADEVVIWSNGDRREFHVHTRDAAEVVSQAYAMGTVFALSIGALEVD